VGIYKQCDICGDASTELNADLYRRWGLALGLKLKPHAKFVVGGDNRSSTPEFLKALMDGLCQAGLDVVNVGQLPTPMIYHARHRLRADGCAVVTASHNPANINGLKWMIGNRPPMPDDVQVLKTAAEKSPPKKLKRTRTQARQLDVSFDYVANLQETWVDAMGTHQHIVLDPMHGCWAGKARRYLHAVFPQCLISSINDTPDPTFADLAPNCAHTHQLHDLCDAVYRERAHLGIAFDGDGDQITLIDNHGVVLTAEETAWLLMETFGRAMRKERFVYDQTFSDHVFQRAKQLGAEAIIEQSVHTIIHNRMIATNALLGVEADGHYFYRALEGGDDGLYTACRIIAFLARTDKSLAQWRSKCPAMYITPILNVGTSIDSQPRIMEKIRQAWSSFPQRDFDGVRIDTPGGWILVRSSNSEPYLSFHFESLDWSALSHLVLRFCESIPDLGEELWDSYISAMGMEGYRK